MNGLAGKVAVVTGGAGGLGSASARRLSAEGCRVVVVDLDGDGASKVAASLPGEAIAVRADVAVEADVDGYLDAAVRAFGQVDLHHLNAGIPGSPGGFPDLDADGFDRVMAVNVRGIFLGLRGAFRLYRSAGSAGSIALTASIASLRGSADLIAYQTSKHAVLGLLRGAAMYGGPLGVRVNAVAPGIVPTNLFPSGGAAPGGRDDMVKRAATSPLRRAGTGDEIASVVAFLLSDESSYMTGETVSVDGGSAIVSTVRPSGGAGAWDFTALDRQAYPPGELTSWPFDWLLSFTSDDKCVGSAIMGPNPHHEIAALDTRKPNVARVWDYWLGGKDNFAVDRDHAEHMLTINPLAAQMARENRQFLSRAVSYVTRAGIRQFIDVGAGLPTAVNTHEIAQGVAPDTKVAYLDHDPVVMRHAEALLAKSPGVIALSGEARDPGAILADHELNELIDFNQPVCVVLCGVLHFLDLEAARKTTAAFIDAMVPGSYGIFSVGVGDTQLAEDFTAEYKAANLRIYTLEEFTSFFVGLEVTPPGVVPAVSWTGHPDVTRLDPGRATFLVGVGRKP